MVKNLKVKLKKTELNIIYSKITSVFFNKSIKFNKLWLKYILIHKGNTFIKILPHKYFSGFFLGDFVFTRKIFYYPKNLKKKKHIRR